MAGASIDAIGVINQIKDNLTDRYDNGFPVLKEIIQNADDAGAKSLQIGWSQGFKETNNELLKTPALFFINDAPLEEAHRDAILSIAQSSKAANKSAVGKFGLGMKSLFHLGEVFFFMSEQWRSKPWAAEVFNPWDKYRENWNQFEDSDKLLINERLGSFLTNTKKPWFIVWVPLRTLGLMADYNHKVIINNYTDNNKLPDFFSEKLLAEKTSEILPQLKNLKRIYFHRHQYDAYFELLISIELRSGSSRSQFNGHELLKNGDLQANFNGKIQALSQSESHTLDYAGYELILKNPDLSRLKSAEMGWPKSYQFDKKAKEPIEALDKAEQHCAVTFSRSKTSSQAFLRANWAVFLPIATTEELPSIAIEGEYDYTISLHGYFFVDSGRKGLHGHSHFAKPYSLEDVKNNEKRLREVWNVILASEGTFSIVLKAFAHFCNTNRTSFEAKSQLTHALHQLFTHANQYKSAITKQDHWLLKVGEHRAEWALIENNQQVLPLPRPNNKDYERVWKTLPLLADLQASNVLSEWVGFEFINHKHYGWRYEQLAFLFNEHLVDVITQETQIEYLNQFIFVIKRYINAEQLDALLVPHLIKALFKHPLAELSRVQTQLKILLSYVSKNKISYVPLGRNEQSLWSEFYGAVSNRVLIPDFLIDSQILDDYQLFFHEELVRLAKRTNDFILKHEIFDTEPNGQNIPSDTNVHCDKLIEHIMQCAKKNHQIDINYFYMECMDYKLFKVTALNSKRRNKYRSLTDLKNLHDEKQLFVRQGANFGLGLGNLLAKVVTGTELCFIKSETSAVEIKGFIDKINPCDSANCLALLARNPSLTQNNTDITELYKHFDNATLTPDEVRGFRYLLHGSKEDTLIHPLWKAQQDTNPVWIHIWQQCQHLEMPKWTIISSDLVYRLTRAQEEILNIKEQSKKGIIQEYAALIPDIDFSDFSEDEINQILIDIDKENESALWKSIPVHLTTKGEKIAISDDCIMDNGIELPQGFDVHLIKQSQRPEIASCQQKWVNVGKPNELIQIALGQENPFEYASFILSQLLLIKASETVLDDSLTELLKTTPWLQAGENAVAPKNVLIFTKQYMPESMAVCENAANVLVHFSQLNEDIFPSTEGKNWLQDFIVIPQKSVAKKLIIAVSQSDEYLIGEIDTLSDAFLDNLSLLPKTLASFSGWRLLNELARDGYLKLNEDSSYLLLARPVESDILCEALEEMADKCALGEMSLARQAFLEALCKNKDAEKYLLELRFKNRNGYYVSGKTLVADVAHADDEQLICETEYQLIKKRCQSFSLSAPSLSDDLDSPDKNAKALSNYFNEWEGRVPSDAIATFLALFSENPLVSELIDGYLKNTTLDTIHNEYQKKWQPISRERGEFSGFTFKSMIKSVHFDIVASGEKTTFMQSIFNERIQVVVNQALDSIILHQKNDSKIKRIELRYFSVKDADKNELLTLLGAAIETIFSSVFNASLQFKTDFCKHFGMTEQGDIQVTRRLVMNQIAPLMLRFQVRTNGIDKLLLDYKREEKANSLSHSNHPDLTRVNTILKQIQDKIETDPAIQAKILTAIRHEISQRFQYSRLSIPFELFQNADDALGELIQMEGEEKATISRFDLNLTNNNSLNFFHWGREVNYLRSTYLDGRGRFENDLEKMVSLNWSDKDEKASGKFGLGFKSALLLSDSPRVVSGDICAEIQAGILPKIPGSDLQRTLNELVQNQSIQGKKPTLIQLPDLKASSKELEDIIQRFNHSAGLLCIFARHINEINVNGQRFSWQGETISTVPGLAIGSIKLPVGDGEKASLRAQQVLVISTSSGQFVFGFRATGVFSFANNTLNSFWALNPIEDVLKLGFCVNAQFAVDIGRSQLAIDNQENKALAHKLGRELAKVLSNMYQQTEHDWPSFATDLKLDPKLTPFDFWRSIWHSLTAEWPKKITTKSSKAELIKQIFVTEGGLLDFYRNCRALPCELNKNQKRLICLKQVTYGADKIISLGFDALKTHPKLSDLYENQKIIHRDLMQVISALNDNNIGFFDEKMSIKPLSFYTLMDQELTESHDEISLNQAQFYGEFFDESFENKISEYEVSVAEKQQIEKRIRKIKLKNQLGYFISPQRMLLPNMSEYDLLSQFAPADFIISNQYGAKALNLATFAQVNKTEFDLISWAKNISANDNQKGGKQEAFCKYLMTLNQSHSLFAAFQKQMPAFCKRNNLSELTLRTAWNWLETDIDTFIKNWLRYESFYLDKDKKDDHIDLIAFSYYWQQNQNKLLTEYDERLYAKQLPWSEMATDHALASLEVRKAWLKLFYLGACQTMGFSFDQTNRNVIDWLENQGVWDKLAAPNGPSREVWADIMENYLTQSQMGSERYRNWMQLLPLYRFTSHLSDYVTLFISADQIHQLSDLIKANDSELLRGTGIRVSELKGTLGIGVNFILRELIRHEVIDPLGSPDIYKHAFVLPKRLRDRLSAAGINMREPNKADPYNSEDVFTYLEKQIGFEDAHFDRSFDIPFRFLLEHENRDEERELLEENATEYEYMLD